jgi:sulfite exporter TauE/SafE
MTLPLVDIGAAFTLALLGAVHCVGMCGGFVGAIQFNRAPSVSPAQLSAGYHAGRLTSYTAGGALIGAIGGGLYATDVLPIQVFLLGLGSVALLAIGVSMFGRSKLLKRLEPLGLAIWRVMAPLARHVVPPRRPLHAWVAGVAWGWIPCGMVYAALPLALTAGGPLQGALVMLGFGVGTLPGLLAVDVGAARLAAIGPVHAANAGAWSGGLRARVRPIAGAAIVVFGFAGLAHAATVAGVNHPAVAALASLCVR